MDRKILLLFLATVTVIIQGCGINSNIMWKQPVGSEVNSDSIPLRPEEDYKISVNDKVSFIISTNEGAAIIEDMAGVNNTLNTTNIYEYEVRGDGMVELPKVGKVHVEGLTIAECEDTLVSKYSHEYKDPFVQAKVTNQRVIVFPGNGGDAKVVPLLNTNTTLMEAIAQAGGIAEEGKANRVKLMRLENGERKVYIMDLSVIEGLKFADMIVQANDYIYVEPTPQVAKELTQQVVPIFSLITSAIVIFTFIQSL